MAARDEAPEGRAHGWTVKSVIALALASLGWSLAPIFIRLCSADFDPFTQSFSRYASGSLMLAGICMVRWRAEFIQLLRQPQRLLGISILNVFMQYVWTAGCYGTPATTAQLIVKLSILFVIVFAYLLFHEERSVIRDWRFLGGTAIAMTGLIFVLMKDAQSLIPVLDTSSLLLLVMSLSWAVYVVWGKHLAWTMHPVPMFGVLSIQTAIGLGLLSFLFGHPAQAMSVSARVWIIAIVSGFISIGLAHPAFQYAQRELGSALCTALNLVNPLFTFLFSLVMLPNERMLPQQWAGAAILLGGMGLVLRAANRRPPGNLAPADPE